MSTNINISVGDNKLLAQASLQQNASRQAQLEKESNKRLQSKAEINRVNALAAQGKDANGNSLIGTRTQVPQLERRPAANRFGEGLLYYFSNPPIYYDDYGNPYGLITKNKAQSPYEFTTIPNSSSPFYRYKSADYVASDGPYNQSYVNAVLYLGTQEARFNNVYSTEPSNMPPSFLESSNSTGYTIEADFRPDEHTDNVVNGINYPTATLIQAAIIKYRSHSTTEVIFDRILIQLDAAQYGGAYENVRVVWPTISGTAPSDVVAPTMPLNLLEWNRIAITVTSLEAKVYINGTLHSSVQNDYGLYNPDYAMWPYPSSSYISAACSFSAKDTANIGNPNPTLSGVTALSAVKITPKILYTENYTPTRIT